MASASQDDEEYALHDTVDGVLLERSSFTNHEPQDQDEHIHLASLVEKKRLWWRNAVINTIFISSWCVILTACLFGECSHHMSHALTSVISRFLFATVLSVYNKWMFAPEHFGFPYPLFVTALHMFVQFALAASIRAIWPKQFRPERNPVRNDYM
jgi:solute carrier family 35 protein C2